MKRDTREALKAAAKRWHMTYEQALAIYNRQPKDMRDEFEKRVAKPREN